MTDEMEILAGASRIEAMFEGHPDAMLAMHSAVQFLEKAAAVIGGEMVDAVASVKAALAPKPAVVPDAGGPVGVGGEVSDETQGPHGPDAAPPTEHEGT
jgi:hypothetical protein